MQNALLSNNLSPFLRRNLTSGDEYWEVFKLPTIIRMKWSERFREELLLTQIHINMSSAIILCCMAAVRIRQLLAV